MIVFILFQTDLWKSKTSRICCGIFDSRKKAKDAAKYHKLECPGCRVMICQMTLNLFEEI